ncbi:MAG: secretin N-terminal domain-containing protein [Rhodocyclaceae bacterium]|nr:secretin N-terminal domain-containing protein [Rhodocyclaceae bacterium]
MSARYRYSLVLFLLLMSAFVPAQTASPPPSAAGMISLVLRDTPIVEVFDMLARSEKVNIVLSKGMTGNVSLNLHGVTLDQAIKAAAEAGGYVAERRGNAWQVVDRKEMGLEEPTAETDVATIKLQYAVAKSVADILTKHLSRYGKVTPLTERNMVVIEDRPASLAKLQRILQALDQEPKQILLEAKILEVTLDNTQTFGIDWRGIINIDSGNATGSFGLGGAGLVSTQAAGTANTALGAFAGKASNGFFASLTGPRLMAYLHALSADGRLHTLSTPRLLVTDGQEAKTQVGDNTGYKVTTTTTTGTSESIEFLDSGVILKVTPSVDNKNRILLKLQPEISSVSVSALGVPSKKSTSVTTQVIAMDGETVFIGGLIKGSSNKTKEGIPGLSDLPIFGGVFGYQKDVTGSTETIVLITPRLVNPGEQGGFAFVPDTATRRLEEQAFKDSQTRKMEPAAVTQPIITPLSVP